MVVVVVASISSISLSAGFSHHLVGKTVRNVSYDDIPLLVN